MPAKKKTGKQTSRNKTQKFAKTDAKKKKKKPLSKKPIAKSAPSIEPGWGPIQTLPVFHRGFLTIEKFVEEGEVAARRASKIPQGADHYCFYEGRLGAKSFFPKKKTGINLIVFIREPYVTESKVVCIKVFRRHGSKWRAECITQGTKINFKAHIAVS